MEEETKNKCHCDESCDFKEQKECTCDNECKCEESCDCGCNEGKECTCNDECHCDESCNCNEEKDKNDKKKKKNKKDELKEALNTINDLNDKLLREKAELVNYRKRKDEEFSRMLKYSNEELVLEMLPVIDNLESAIKMDDTNLEDEISKFLQGFKMIYGNLITVLEKFDIKPIDGINKPFDPAYHQAVMTEKVENTESGIIIDVLRKGYILKDKVIRPAMVKVSE